MGLWRVLAWLPVLACSHVRRVAHHPRVVLQALPQVLARAADVAVSRGLPVRACSTSKQVDEACLTLI